MWTYECKLHYFIRHCSPSYSTWHTIDEWQDEMNRIQHIWQFICLWCIPCPKEKIVIWWQFVRFVVTLYEPYIRGTALSNIRNLFSNPNQLQIFYLFPLKSTRVSLKPWWESDPAVLTLQFVRDPVSLAWYPYMATRIGFQCTIQLWTHLYSASVGCSFAKWQLSRVEARSGVIVFFFYHRFSCCMWLTTCIFWFRDE